MSNLRALICVFFSASLVQACPESCCIDAPIFMIEEDKCLLTKDSQTLTTLIMNEMGKSDQNLFISPFSVSNILYLLLLASRGETAEELSLALSADTVNIHEAGKCLIDKVLDPLDPALNNTNDFFMNSGYKGRDSDYISQAKVYYRASFHNCNFEKRPEKARQRVNKIVAFKSNNLITDLFDPGSINNDTKVIIVNTIAFRSNWLHQFDKDLTRKSGFYVKQGKTVQTNFMKAEANFSHQWVSNIASEKDPIPVEILDMPYESSQYSLMAIKFSDAKDLYKDLGKIEEFVANNGILTIKNLLEYAILNIEFPKFKMTYNQDMNKIFTPATGLGIVFSPRANYSGFADNLVISNIIHKAAIVVTEEGTIASGASAGHFIQRDSQRQMAFDSPFVFFIYHACDGLVLFQGRYAFPPDLPAEIPEHPQDPDESFQPGS